MDRSSGLGGGHVPPGPSLDPPMILHTCVRHAGAPSILSTHILLLNIFVRTDKGYKPQKASKSSWYNCGYYECRLFLFLPTRVEQLIGRRFIAAFSRAYTCCWCTKCYDVTLTYLVTCSLDSDDANILTKITPQ